MKTNARILSLSVLILFTFNVLAQEAAPLAEPAEKILEKAFSQAKKEKKKVIVMFHASWCGWCKKMDASLTDETCKDFFDRNYVITHLVVLESKGKENLENPGAKAIFDKYSAGSSGIPFWLIYDSKGNVLEDALMPKVGKDGTPGKANIGCPASDEEVEQFVGKIRRTSKITEPQLLIIAERFKKNRS